MDEYKIREAFEKVRDDINELKAEIKKTIDRVNELAIEVKKKKKR